MDPDDVVIVFPSVSAPILVFAMIFLQFARTAARAEDLERAEKFATRAVSLSWLLCGAAALGFSLFLGSGASLWSHIEVAAALSISVPVWYWAQSLRASIRARRAAGETAAPDRPR